MGLLHPGLPSTLKAAPELPGALEAVLRSSHLADVETETKHQEAHIGSYGLMGGITKKESDLGRYLHLKCQGAVGNLGHICLNGEHLLFPMRRGGTSAMCLHHSLVLMIP